jgi:hypothetical protein
VSVRTAPAVASEIKPFHFLRPYADPQRQNRRSQQGPEDLTLARPKERKQPVLASAIVTPPPLKKPDLSLVRFYQRLLADAAASTFPALLGEELAQSWPGSGNPPPSRVCRAVSMAFGRHDEGRATIETGTAPGWT